MRRARLHKSFERLFFTEVNFYKITISIKKSILYFNSLLSEWFFLQKTFSI
ncbi:hypothetical protein P872_09690 [Rhodonellum psychrophilum GCM71 = DSM 17998]|uniref:Uncharacterized protein n=1 Tax=Rhodonellum psychrophilum GCM71 = DSM 17998 TaxID=1123057 RepID=U5BUJ7_9BACT|nr:hypothetical protein P872_09690 [Rhodonellum psychrophilum GCM71 = DSM 17998]